MFSDECPLLQPRVFCTHWDGLDKSGGVDDAVDDKEFEGDDRYVKTSSQRVEIHMNFIGEAEFLNAECEPTPEELAEKERIEKERERNRLRYLKRKKSGYYDKAKKEPQKAEQLYADMPIAANQ